MRDPRHIMTCYRQYILACKRKWGSARSLVHYHEIVREYLDAKKRCSAKSEG